MTFYEAQVRVGVIENLVIDSNLGGILTWLEAIPAGARSSCLGTAPTGGQC